MFNSIFLNIVLVILAFIGVLAIIFVLSELISEYLEGREQNKPFK